MTLPFSETTYRVRSHDEGKDQVEFQFLYAPHLALKDQQEEQSIPLDKDTIMRVERFMRERSGQRA